MLMGEVEARNIFAGPDDGYEIPEVCNEMKLPMKEIGDQESTIYGNEKKADPFGHIPALRGERLMAGCCALEKVWALPTGFNSLI